MAKKLFPLDSHGLNLKLWRFKHDGKPRVLLLHGASACHETFLFPNGKSLVDDLLEHYEPWLLDWCGSNLVIGEHRGAGNWVPERFDFDNAAQYDLPDTLEFINKHKMDNGKDAEPVTKLIGFCMGSAVIAQSIAAGHLKDYRIKNLVLMSIGLFYRSTGEGKLKLQDHVLERLLADEYTDDRFVDSRCYKGTHTLEHAWHPSFEALYNIWPDYFKPHHKRQVNDRDEACQVPAQCNRVTFMFGQPYVESRLFPEIHGSSTELAKQFGMIPLRMYAQAANNARRGWAAEQDAEKKGTQGELLGEEAKKNFGKLKRITLVTGNDNRIWQRDSIDSMYEWLLRGTTRGRDRIAKHVLDGYGHQDLLWGKDSGKDVYPKIIKGLV